MEEEHNAIKTLFFKHLLVGASVSFEPQWTSSVHRLDNKTDLLYSTKHYRSLSIVTQCVQCKVFPGNGSESVKSKPSSSPSKNRGKF